MLYKTTFRLVKKTNHITDVLKKIRKDVILFSFFSLCIMISSPVLYVIKTCGLTRQLSWHPTINPYTHLKKNTFNQACGHKQYQHVPASSLLVNALFLCTNKKRRKKNRQKKDDACLWEHFCFIVTHPPPPFPHLCSEIGLWLSGGRGEVDNFSAAGISGVILVGNSWLPEDSIVQLVNENLASQSMCSLMYFSSYNYLVKLVLCNTCLSST